MKQGYIVIFTILAICFGGMIMNAQAQGVRQAEIVKPAERDPEQWATAVCNDSTPFAFTFDASPSGSTDWVMHLEGGGACSGIGEDCSSRAPRLTTTLDGVDGSFTPQVDWLLVSRDPAVNPTFHDANFVLASYCSSDFWSGTKTGRTPVTGVPEGWIFAGRTNVTAMLETLIQQYGLDDSSPETLVLFAGSSAGGVGVIANADNIAALLPQTAAADRLKLVNDAGYAPDLRGVVSAEVDATFSGTLTAYDIWGSRVNPLCEQAQIAVGELPGTCALGAVSYPFITAAAPNGLGLPYLVQESSLDGSIMRRAGIHLRQPLDQEAVFAVRDAILASLNGVEWAFSGGETAYHTLLPRHNWTLSSPDGTSFYHLLTQFWEGGTPQRVIWTRS